MFRFIWSPLSVLLILAVQVPPAIAQAKAEIGAGLVPIVQGNRLTSFADRPERFRQTAVYRAARTCGVDITAPEHPLAICAFKNRRLFYLFYNIISNVPESQAQQSPPYLIQRVKRTVINSPGNGEPQTEVDYLVEAMKTIDGRMKSPDQHFGNFGLHEFARRKIVKEFEIGVGAVDGIAQAGPWPFGAPRLYQQIQAYQPESAAYDKCRFATSFKWTLAVEFDALGNYSLVSPELGIELVHRLPQAFDAAEAAVPIAASQQIVLQEGQGVFGLEVGKSRLEEVQRKLGEPTRVQAPNATAKNYEFANGLTFNIPNGGTINTIFTQPGFLGKTSRGARHGDTRDEVTQTYGKTNSRGRTQAHDGILFWFDTNDRVEKIVVYRKAERRRN